MCKLTPTTYKVLYTRKPINSKNTRINVFTCGVLELKTNSVNRRLDQNPKIVNDIQMNKIQLHLASSKTSGKNMPAAELCLMPEFKLPQSKASGF